MYLMFLVLNVLRVVKESIILKKMGYFVSSSTYGDCESHFKLEEKIGNHYLHYAVTKYVNKLYSDVFSRSYKFHLVGLRYFNVFGSRRDPNGAYAAVRPLFFDGAINNKPIKINGDGEQTRDFTFIENVVQANIKAIFTTFDKHEVYNIACGERISVNRLWETIKELTNTTNEAIYGPTKLDDVKDSLASIEKASNQLGYKPTFNFKIGIGITLSYFLNYDI